MAIKVKYIGKGEWLPGIPASDHEVETEAEAKELVKSGLYKVEKPGKEGDA